MEEGAENIAEEAQQLILGALRHPDIFSEEEEEEKEGRSDRQQMDELHGMKEERQDKQPQNPENSEVARQQQQHKPQTDSKEASDIKQQRELLQQEGFVQRKELPQEEGFLQKVEDLLQERKLSQQKESVKGKPLMRERETKQQRESVQQKEIVLHSKLYPEGELSPETKERVQERRILQERDLMRGREEMEDEKGRREERVRQQQELMEKRKQTEQHGLAHQEEMRQKEINVQQKKMLHPKEKRHQQKDIAEQKETLQREERKKHQEETAEQKEKLQLEETGHQRKTAEHKELVQLKEGGQHGEALQQKELEENKGSLVQQKMLSEHMELMQKREDVHQREMRQQVKELLEQRMLMKQEKILDHRNELTQPKEKRHQEELTQQNEFVLRKNVVKQQGKLADNDEVKQQIDRRQQKEVRQSQEERGAEHIDLTQQEGLEVRTAFHKEMPLHKEFEQQKESRTEEEMTTDRPLHKELLQQTELGEYEETRRLEGTENTREELVKQIDCIVQQKRLRQEEEVPEHEELLHRQELVKQRKEMKQQEKELRGLKAPMQLQEQQEEAVVHVKEGEQQKEMVQQEALKRHHTLSEHEDDVKEHKSPQEEGILPVSILTGVGSEAQHMPLQQQQSHEQTKRYSHPRLHLMHQQHQEEEEEGKTNLLTSEQQKMEKEGGWLKGVQHQKKHTENVREGVIDVAFAKPADISAPVGDATGPASGSFFKRGDGTGERDSAVHCEDETWPSKTMQNALPALNRLTTAPAVGQTEKNADKLSAARQALCEVGAHSEAAKKAESSCCTGKGTTTPLQYRKKEQYYPTEETRFLRPVSKEKHQQERHSREEGQTVEHQQVQQQERQQQEQYQPPPQKQLRHPLQKQQDGPKQQQQQGEEEEGEDKRMKPQNGGEKNQNQPQQLQDEENGDGDGDDDEEEEEEEQVSSVEDGQQENKLKQQQQQERQQSVKTQQQNGVKQRRQLEEDGVKQKQREQQLQEGEEATQTPVENKQQSCVKQQRVQHEEEKKKQQHVISVKQQQQQLQDHGEKKQEQSRVRQRQQQQLQMDEEEEEENQESLTDEHEQSDMKKQHSQQEEEKEKQQCVNMDVEPQYPEKEVQRSKRLPRRASQQHQYRQPHRRQLQCRQQQQQKQQHDEEEQKNSQFMSAAEETEQQKDDDEIKKTPIGIPQQQRKSPQQQHCRRHQQQQEAKQSWEQQPEHAENKEECERSHTPETRKSLQQSHKKDEQYEPQKRRVNPLSSKSEQVEQGGSHSRVVQQRKQQRLLEERRLGTALEGNGVQAPHQEQQKQKRQHNRSKRVRQYQPQQQQQRRSSSSAEELQQQREQRSSSSELKRRGKEPPLQEKERKVKQHEYVMRGGGGSGSVHEVQQQQQQQQSTFFTQQPQYVQQRNTIKEGPGGGFPKEKNTKEKKHAENGEGIDQWISCAGEGARAGAAAGVAGPLPRPQQPSTAGEEVADGKVPTELLRPLEEQQGRLLYTYPSSTTSVPCSAAAISLSNRVEANGGDTTPPQGLDAETPPPATGNTQQSKKHAAKTGGEIEHFRGARGLPFRYATEDEAAPPSAGRSAADIERNEEMGGGSSSGSSKSRQWLSGVVTGIPDEKSGTGKEERERGERKGSRVETEEQLLEHQLQGQSDMPKKQQQEQQQPYEGVSYETCQRWRQSVHERPHNTRLRQQPQHLHAPQQQPQHTQQQWKVRQHQQQQAQHGHKQSKDRQQQQWKEPQQQQVHEQQHQRQDQREQQQQHWKERDEQQALDEEEEDEENVKDFAVSGERQQHLCRFQQVGGRVYPQRMQQEDQEQEMKLEREKCSWQQEEQDIYTDEKEIAGREKPLERMLNAQSNPSQHSTEREIDLLQELLQQETGQQASAALLSEFLSVTEKKQQASEPLFLHKDSEHELLWDHRQQQYLSRRGSLSSRQQQHQGQKQTEGDESGFPNEMQKQQQQKNALEQQQQEDRVVLDDTTREDGQMLSAKVKQRQPYTRWVPLHEQQQQQQGRSSDQGDTACRVPCIDQQPGEVLVGPRQKQGKKCQEVGEKEEKRANNGGHINRSGGRGTEKINSESAAVHDNFADVVHSRVYSSMRSIAPVALAAQSSEERMNVATAAEEGRSVLEKPEQEVSEQERPAATIAAPRGGIDGSSGVATASSVGTETRSLAASKKNPDVVCDDGKTAQAVLSSSVNDSFLQSTGGTRFNIRAAAETHLPAASSDAIDFSEAHFIKRKERNDRGKHQSSIGNSSSSSSSSNINSSTCMRESANLLQRQADDSAALLQQWYSRYSSDEGSSSSSDNKTGIGHSSSSSISEYPTDSFSRTSSGAYNDSYFVELTSNNCHTNKEDEGICSTSRSSSRSGEGPSNNKTNDPTMYSSSSMSTDNYSQSRDDGCSDDLSLYVRGTNSSTEKEGVYNKSHNHRANGSLVMGSNFYSDFSHSSRRSSSKHDDGCTRGRQNDIEGTFEGEESHWHGRGTGISLQPENEEKITRECYSGSGSSSQEGVGSSNGGNNTRRTSAASSVFRSGGSGKPRRAIRSNSNDNYTNKASSACSSSTCGPLAHSTSIHSNSSMHDSNKKKIGTLEEAKNWCGNVTTTTVTGEKKTPLHIGESFESSTSADSSTASYELPSFSGEDSSSSGSFTESRSSIRGLLHDGNNRSSSSNSSSNASEDLRRSLSTSTSGNFVQAYLRELHNRVASVSTSSSMKRNTVEAAAAAMAAAAAAAVAEEAGSNAALGTAAPAPATSTTAAAVSAAAAGAALAGAVAGRDIAAAKLATAAEADQTREGIGISRLPSPPPNRCNYTGNMRCSAAEAAAEHEKQQHEYAARHKALPKVTGVRYQAQRSRFVAEWYEQGRTRMAYFPVKVYGFERARALAIKRRKEVLLWKNAQLGLLPSSPGSARPSASAAGGGAVNSNSSSSSRSRGSGGGGVGGTGVGGGGGCGGRSGINVFNNRRRGGSNTNSHLSGISSNDNSAGGSSFLYDNAAAAAALAAKYKAALESSCLSILSSVKEQEEAGRGLLPGALASLQSLSCSSYESDVVAAACRNVRGEGEGEGGGGGGGGGDAYFGSSAAEQLSRVAKNILADRATAIHDKAGDRTHQTSTRLDAAVRNFCTYEWAARYLSCQTSAGSRSSVHTPSDIAGIAAAAPARGGGRLDGPEREVAAAAAGGKRTRGGGGSETRTTSTSRGCSSTPSTKRSKTCSKSRAPAATTVEVSGIEATAAHTVPELVEVEEDEGHGEEGEEETAEGSKGGEAGTGGSAGGLEQDTLLPGRAGEDAAYVDTWRWLQWGNQLLHQRAGSGSYEEEASAARSSMRSAASGAAAARAAAAAEATVRLALTSDTTSAIEDLTSLPYAAIASAAGAAPAAAAAAAHGVATASTAALTAARLSPAAAAAAALLPSPSSPSSANTTLSSAALLGLPPPAAAAAAAAATAGPTSSFPSLASVLPGSLPPSIYSTSPPPPPAAATAAAVRGGGGTLANEDEARTVGNARALADVLEQHLRLTQAAETLKRDTTGTSAFADLLKKTEILLRSYVLQLQRQLQIQQPQQQRQQSQHSLLYQQQFLQQQQQLLQNQTAEVVTEKQQQQQIIDMRHRQQRNGRKNQQGLTSTSGSIMEEEGLPEDEVVHKKPVKDGDATVAAAAAADELLLWTNRSTDKDHGRTGGRGTFSVAATAAERVLLAGGAAAAASAHKGDGDAPAHETIRRDMQLHEQQKQHQQRLSQGACTGATVKKDIPYISQQQQQQAWLSKGAVDPPSPSASTFAGSPRSSSSGSGSCSNSSSKSPQTCTSSSSRNVSCTSPDRATSSDGSPHTGDGVISGNSSTEDSRFLLLPSLLSSSECFDEGPSLIGGSTEKDETCCSHFSSSSCTISSSSPPTVAVGSPAVAAASPANTCGATPAVAGHHFLPSVLASSPTPCSTPLTASSPSILPPEPDSATIAAATDCRATSFFSRQQPPIAKRVGTPEDSAAATLNILSVNSGECCQQQRCLLHGTAAPATAPLSIQNQQHQRDKLLQRQTGRSHKGASYFAENNNVNVGEDEDSNDSQCMQEMFDFNKRKQRPRRQTEDASHALSSAALSLDSSPDVPAALLRTRRAQMQQSMRESQKKQQHRGRSDTLHGDGTGYQLLHTASMTKNEQRDFTPQEKNEEDLQHLGCLQEEGDPQTVAAANRLLLRWQSRGEWEKEGETTQAQEMQVEQEQLHGHRFQQLQKQQQLQQILGEKRQSLALQKDDEQQQYLLPILQQHYEKHYSLDEAEGYPDKDFSRTQSKHTLAGGSRLSSVEAPMLQREPDASLHTLPSSAVAAAIAAAAAAAMLPSSSPSLTPSVSPTLSRRLSPPLPSSLTATTTCSSISGGREASNLAASSAGVSPRNPAAAALLAAAAALLPVEPALQSRTASLSSAAAQDDDLLSAHMLHKHASAPPSTHTHSSLVDTPGSVVVRGPVGTPSAATFSAVTPSDVVAGTPAETMIAAATCVQMKDVGAEYPTAPLHEDKNTTTAQSIDVRTTCGAEVSRKQQHPQQGMPLAAPLSPIEGKQEEEPDEGKDEARVSVTAGGQHTDACEAFFASPTTRTQSCRHSFEGRGPPAASKHAAVAMESQRADALPALLGGTASPMATSDTRTARYASIGSTDDLIRGSPDIVKYLPSPQPLDQVEVEATTSIDILRHGLEETATLPTAE